MDPEFRNPAPGESVGDRGGEAVAVEESLRAQLAEQKSLHLIMAADFENFKRRSRLEIETRAAAQKDSFIQDLLPSIDNLERALAAEVSVGSPQFRKGVEMTLQQLRLLLRQHGIESDEILGQVFDPHQHEAVSQRRSISQPALTILEVFQRGYRRGAKVFRPAKVVVNDWGLPK